MSLARLLAPSPPQAQDVAARRLERKRLADRLYQRRHRAKREQVTRELEVSVSALHSDIARLHAHRDVLARRVASRALFPLPSRDQLRAHACAVVHQYLRVFGGSSASPVAQERFLRLVLTPDAAGVGLRGVDAFVRQLKLYAACFPSCELWPSAAVRARSAGDLLVFQVDVVLRLRLSPRRAADLFPALRRVDPERAARLVGLLASPEMGLDVNGTLTFVFDATGAVTSLLTDLELLDALQVALGSLVDTALVADGARIAFESGVIRDELLVLMDAEKHMYPSLSGFRCL